ncbi:hypothetical protein RCJ22_02400, partial [Vibrio sp. FNV 38]|nr:hypothetical protein [Vibrio sp. FNV 38]
METAEWTTDISQAKKIKLQNLNYNWTNGVFKAESNLGTKISLFPGTYELIEVEATNGTADMPGYNLTVNGTLTIPESYNETVLFSVTNTYARIPMQNLTVKKTVTGNGADTDKEFTFTLNVQDAAAADTYE